MKNFPFNIFSNYVEDNKATLMAEGGEIL